VKKIEKEREKPDPNMPKSRLTGAIVLNAKGRIVLFSPVAEELFLYSSDEVINKSFKILLPEEISRSRPLKSLLNGDLKEGGPVVRHPGFPFRRKDGTSFALDVAFAKASRQGKRIIIISVRSAYDPMEAETIEDALGKSEALYRAVVEDQTEIICRWLPDSTLTFVNETCCRYLGKSRNELIGHGFKDMIIEEDRDKFEKHIASLVNENPVGTIEHRVRLPNGDVRWMEWTHRAMFDGNGRTIEFQSVGRDVTRRKQAEEIILSYQVELRSLVSEMSLAEERVRRSIATDLHDRVGQTLAVLNIKLDVLRKAVSSTSMARPLEEISQLTELLIQETRSLMFELSPPVLYELGLEAALEWLGVHIQEKFGLLVQVVDDRELKVLDDDVRTLLFKAVRELVTNIVTHARAHHAKVSVNREGDAIRISVEDDGAGFEPSKISQNGGFGLFSIRERLKHLGGHLEIESQPGHGTRVTLSAPMKNNQQSSGRNAA
jgi:PAS domain S-box-containing protein